MRSALALAALYLLPQGIERVEIGTGRMFGGEQLDAAKTAIELSRRPAQRRFRIDLELACEVGDGEEDIAQLVLQHGALRVPLDLRPEFGDLLDDLFHDRPGIGPVEADARRAPLDLCRAQQ